MDFFIGHGGPITKSDQLVDMSYRAPRRATTASVEVVSHRKSCQKGSADVTHLARQLLKDGQHLRFGLFCDASPFWYPKREAIARKKRLNSTRWASTNLPVSMPDLDARTVRSLSLGLNGTPEFAGDSDNQCKGSNFGATNATPNSID